MGMVPISQAPNFDEMLRAANGFGHETHISSDHWIGDPNMNVLGLEDSHYGVPGIGLGAGDAGQQISQIFGQAAQIYALNEQQKQAARQAAIEARQAKLAAFSSGGSSSSSGDFAKTLLILGAIIVVGYLLMQMMKKKSGGSSDHQIEYKPTEDKE